jgi:two-component SAPR family response regulator
MIRQVVTRVSIDSFRNRSEGKKVVLLYPWTSYRNLFLSHFLDSAKNGLLYYRIPSTENNLIDWVQGLIKELDEVLGGFGSNTKQAFAKENPVELGQCLAVDLGQFSRESLVLFIDELDRVPHDDGFQKFIRALVDNLPKNAQLAFSSRLLTHQPWYEMVASGEAVVLGTEHRKNDVMFTVEERPKPQLEVYALGRGYALVNGQQITNWDGALPRNLFFFFIDRPLVTRDEIFEVFWPNLSVKEATNVFHVTKRKISERISMKVEGGGNYELTQYSSGFYMPSDKIVRHYDIADFQEAVEQALVTTDERKEENLLSRAIDLYKAPFLQTINMKWVEERREYLRQLYAQALIGIGRLQLRRDDKERALGFFTRALKEVQEREDIHREVMKLYLHMGMVNDARQQYHRLEEILQSTIGISPSRESREVYEKIIEAS